MSLIYKFIEMILNALPDSPVIEWVTEFKSAEWLGYLNYFIPISFMVNATMIWAGLIITYRIVLFAISAVRIVLNK